MTTKQNDTPVAPALNAQHLGFQRCSDGMVRALRFCGDELLSSRFVGDAATACALIDSFKRDFSNGRILIETDDGEDSFPLARGKQLTDLFYPALHPTT